VQSEWLDELPCKGPTGMQRAQDTRSLGRISVAGEPLWAD
jgi:hypothetical protein